MCESEEWYREIDPNSLSEVFGGFCGKFPLIFLLLSVFTAVGLIYQAVDYSQKIQRLPNIMCLARTVVYWQTYILIVESFTVVMALVALYWVFTAKKMNRKLIAIAIFFVCLMLASSGMLYTFLPLTDESGTVIRDDNNNVTMYYQYELIARRDGYLRLAYPIYFDLQDINTTELNLTCSFVEIRNFCTAGRLSSFSNHNGAYICRPSMEEGVAWCYSYLLPFSPIAASAMAFQAGFFWLFTAAFGTILGRRAIPKDEWCEIDHARSLYKRYCAPNKEEEDPLLPRDNNQNATIEKQDGGDAQQDGIHDDDVVITTSSPLSPDVQLGPNSTEGNNSGGIQNLTPSSSQQDPTDSQGLMDSSTRDDQQDIKGLPKIVSNNEVDPGTIEDQKPSENPNEIGGPENTRSQRAIEGQEPPIGD